MEEHIITSGPAAPGSASPKSVAPKFGGRVQLKTFHPKLDGRDLEDIPRIPMAMPGYDNRKRRRHRENRSKNWGGFLFCQQPILKNCI